MPWARFDDQMPFHAKVVAAGNGGVGLWVRMITWSCGQLTDGFVPNAIAKLLDPKGRDTKAAVDAKLLEKANDGYRIHDYADWQPTADQVRQERAATAERVKRLRNGRRNGVTQSVTETVTNADSNADCTPSPSDPIPTEVHTPAGARASGPTSGALTPGAFDAVWWRVVNTMPGAPSVLGDVLRELRTLRTKARPAMPEAEFAEALLVEYRAMLDEWKRKDPPIDAPATAAHFGRAETMARLLDRMNGKRPAPKGPETARPQPPPAKVNVPTEAEAPPPGYQRVGGAG